jgi:hypothetical protein
MIKKFNQDDIKGVNKEWSPARSCWETLLGYTHNGREAAVVQNKIAIQVLSHSGTGAERWLWIERALERAAQCCWIARFACASRASTRRLNS